MKLNITTLGTLASVVVLVGGVAAHLFKKGAADESQGSSQLGKRIPTTNLYRCGDGCVFLGSYRAYIDPRGAALGSYLPANTTISKRSTLQLNLFIPLDTTPSKLPAFPLEVNLTPPVTRVVGWSYSNNAVYFEDGTLLRPKDEGLTAYPLGSWWHLVANPRNPDELVYKTRVISTPTIKLASGARYYRDDPNEPPPAPFIP